MNLPLRILVLSAGDGAGINFCNSLKLCEGKYHIIGSDTNIYRLHYATADEKFLLPSVDKGEYWSTLILLIDKTKPDFIYAADTNKELELLSERREEIFVPFFLPPKEAVNIYENKWQSYLFFKNAGLIVPETILITEPKDIDYAINKLGSIWLRAIRGSGGNGSLPTNDPMMAKAWVSRYNGWGNFTAATVLSKKMATWIGIWQNGELVVCQGRKRLHWEYANLSPSGVTGITGAQSTTSDPILQKVAIDAISSIPIRPHGIVSVDMTYDNSDIPNPTEIQASRFYSSIYFLAKAGFNLPDIYVTIALTGVIPTHVKRLNPLPDDLVWLKAVDFMPKLITLNELIKSEKEYAVK